MTSDVALDSDLLVRAPSCSPRKALSNSSCAIEVSSSSRGVVLIEASTMKDLFLRYRWIVALAMLRAAGLLSVCGSKRLHEKIGIAFLRLHIEDNFLNLPPSVPVLRKNSLQGAREGSSAASMA